MKIKKGLSLYDMQFPLHNEKLLDAVERYMGDEKFDYLVYGGDMLDMNAISHWSLEGGNARALEGKRLKKDYEEFGKILRKHRKLVGDDCEIYFLLGNHEENGERFIDKFPTLEGLIEVINNLPFKELNIKLIPYRSFVKLGKIHFIHGDIDSGKYISNNHAKKMVEIYNRNVVYGHHHTLMSYTKISPVGIDETHTAYCLPCMADTQPEWAKDKPNSWLNGFGVFYISDEGNFSVFPVVSIKNRFISPEGKLY